MLNLARCGAVGGVLLAIAAVFGTTTQADQLGGAGVGAFLLAVWLHEEHASDRAQTFAATSIQAQRTPPPALGDMMTAAATALASSTVTDTPPTSSSAPEGPGTPRARAVIR